MRRQCGPRTQRAEPTWRPRPRRRCARRTMCAQWETAFAPRRRGCGWRQEASPPGKLPCRRFPYPNATSVQLAGRLTLVTLLATTTRAAHTRLRCFSLLVVTRRGALQVAAQIVRDRDALAAGAATARGVTIDAADAALREVCAALASTGAAPRAELSESALEVAMHLDHGGMAAPRDLGVIPMEALRSLLSAPSTAATPSGA